MDLYSLQFTNRYRDTITLISEGVQILQSFDYHQLRDLQLLFISDSWTTSREMYPLVFDQQLGLPKVS